MRRKGGLVLVFSRSMLMSPCIVMGVLGCFVVIWVIASCMLYVKFSVFGRL